MITDPQRAKRSDPGNPDVCNVFSFHEIYTPLETVAQIDSECRTAKIGCVECKKLMGANLIKALEPLREKRNELASNLDQVKEIMAEGDRRARKIAQQTMAEVKAAIRM
jgi:tryptophanyl-tRNA synthetase